MLPVLDSFEVGWVLMEKKYSDQALSTSKAMYVSPFYNFEWFSLTYWLMVDNILYMLF